MARKYCDGSPRRAEDTFGWGRAAVETGLIPVTMAIEVARAETEEAQNLLLEAYETGKLKGKKLASVRQIGRAHA